LISEVPEEISACEFDCRKRECRMGGLVALCTAPAGHVRHCQEEAGLVSA
jgi:hypothetical protein